MTDYKKWEKYDVKEAENAVEEAAQVDARASQLDKLDREQWGLERSTVNDSLRDVESYESKAAVEELRRLSKSRPKRGAAKTAGAPTPVPDQPPELSEASAASAPAPAPAPAPAVPTNAASLPVASPTPPPVAPVSESLKQSHLAALKAQKLQSSIDSREKGKQLAKEGNYAAALTTFIAGLATLDEFEALSVQPAPAVSSSSSSSSSGAAAAAAAPSSSSSPDVCCGGDAAKLKQQQNLLTPDPLRPSKSNVHVSLRRDFHVLLGRSHLTLGRETSASDSFKSVLLLDPGNVGAWVARAECFRRMRLYTLAELHLVKALDLDDVDRSAKALKRENDDDLLRHKAAASRGDVDGGEEDPINVEVNSRRSAKDLLQDGLRTYRQGDVIFREQFLQTAALKYSRAAACLSAAERVLNCRLPDALLSVLVAAHLGAAACSLLRRRDFGSAEGHCTAALRAGGGRNVTALLRRSEARAEIGNWEGAIEDLQLCRTIVERSGQTIKKRMSTDVPGNAEAASSIGKSATNVAAAIAEIAKRLKKVVFLQSQSKGSANPELLGA